MLFYMTSLACRGIFIILHQNPGAVVTNIHSHHNTQGIKHLRGEAPIGLYYFKHGLWVSTLAFELIQEVWCSAAFFRSLTIAQIFRNTSKISLSEASFWRCDKLIQRSWASEKRRRSIKLAGQLKSYFCVGIFLSRHPESVLQTTPHDGSVEWLPVVRWWITSKGHAGVKWYDVIKSGWSTKQVPIFGSLQDGGPIHT